MFWAILIIWLGAAFTVGLFANLRGRDGIGWFALAIFISSPSAGLLLFALPRKRPPFDEKKISVQKIGRASQSVLSTFKPDGVYAGITYMVTHDGAIVAVMNQRLIRFGNMDDFLAAATERVAA